MAVILAPSVPPVLRAMFSIPNIALQNAMACRVFRLLKLGLITDAGPTLFTSYHNPHSAGSAAVKFHGERSTQRTQVGDIESFVMKDRNSKPIAMHVDINRETEITVDTPDNDSQEWKGKDIV